MPLSVDDTGLLTGLDRLLQAIDQATDDGLADGADLMQADLQATRAHGDQSGATRASYRAYPIGPGHDGSAESTSGYAAAADDLSGFTGHGGQALRQDSGVVLGADQKGIILTSFTDYQDKLETENAGDKATLGPTLQQDAEQATVMVAAASKRRLGG